MQVGCDAFSGRHVFFLRFVLLLSQFAPPPGDAIDAEPVPEKQFLQCAILRRSLAARARQLDGFWFAPLQS
ncbi:hypothetical protein P389DRAFT_164488 [Cystobasidium minutum MCA 4210]|uniref:uncharacterized protein n=1 Tax=Cystobasidium minutum MCA 4210 TaxID=1397322 RepID=UPI0034CE4DE5|eukprot:jgi/Rhomi1/164488/fgenesh1_kg.1_\